MRRPSKHADYKGLNPIHRERIKAFEKAVRAHDNMGAQHPQDHRAIEEELDHSRKILVETIFNLYGKARDHAGRAKKIEQILYKMIGTGGGDATTIKQFAERIAQI